MKHIDWPPQIPRFSQVGLSVRFAPRCAIYRRGARSSGASPAFGAVGTSCEGLEELGLGGGGVARSEGPKTLSSMEFSIAWYSNYRNFHGETSNCQFSCPFPPKKCTSICPNQHLFFRVHFHTQNLTYTKAGFGPASKQLSKLALVDSMHDLSLELKLSIFCTCRVYRCPRLSECSKDRFRDGKHRSVAAINHCIRKDRKEKSIRSSSSRYFCASFSSPASAITLAKLMQSG